MLKLVCNESCNQEFVLLEFGVEAVAEGIERVGFDCPHCGHKYTSYYLNEKIKRLQAKQRELLRVSDPNKHPKAVLKKNLRLIAANRKRIKAEMDRLRAIVEGGT